MIGIISSQIFSSLLNKPEIVITETPFGKPSSPISVGTVEDKEVALIIRHGLQHEFPPHKVPYKANIYALKELGVKRIVSISPGTSLKTSIRPGSLVIPDQFVNFSKREDTFYEERPITHINASEPYCPEMLKIMAECIGNSINATAVTIEGPRSPSLAESLFYASNGWDIVSMSQYPEVVLARELEICYANISLIADYETAVKKQNGHDFTMEELIEMAGRNNENAKNVVLEMILKMPEIRQCICSRALEDSR